MTSEAAFDSREFRRALGCFPTGVTVICTREPNGTPRGITANSFGSVSLEPPLISICIDHRAASLEVFRACRSFAINVLSEQQRDVSDLFATKAPDKFERVVWRPGRLDAPLLDASVATFECEPFTAQDAGDHLLMLGRVRFFTSNDAPPLGFCRGNYLEFGLERRAVLQTATDLVRVGCILDHAGQVLLKRSGDNWVLPSGQSRDEEDPNGLQAALNQLGVDARIGFLFAVFDGPHARELSIFYRGEILAEPQLPAHARLFPYDSIPWEQLPSDADRSMLARYVNERRRYRFGIYVGSADSGDVAPLL